ncbi:pro-neuregulin-4, membrane-bound isoform isoform X2 [Alexandromys fortis]|uniref:pro-neuregulin-4, membrane-bound isoform isoform X2 n=1 Tax=Alexandromys fortis TaxID=100897 RepID=UPI00215315CF|nr:pro-neuregulin-4, membrane-bound isoform isoform X2 [Microtus fortis]
MPTGALRITQELVAKRFFSQAPASKAEVTCRQQSWPWRSYSRSPLQRSAFCAGRATFRGPVQSSVRSAWWRETPAPTTGTEITEGMPSEGHYCGHLTQEESKLHGERRFNSPSPRGPVTTTDVFTSYFPDSSAAMIRFAAQTTCLLLLASQINFKQN